MAEGTACGRGLLPVGRPPRTGLLTAGRNRPEHLARRGAATGRRSMTFDEMKGMLAEAGRVRHRGRPRRARRLRRHRGGGPAYLIARDLDPTVERLHRRADAIGAGRSRPTTACRWPRAGYSTIVVTPATRPRPSPATQYGGSQLYVDEPAVTDGGLVTASGTAPVEFARAAFALLDLYEPPVLASWYKLFGLNDPAGYFELMAAAS